MSMKDKLNHPIAIILMIIVFLALTAIAAVEYNGDRASTERIREGGLYRLGSACVSAGEKFFGFMMVGTNDKNEDDAEEDKAASGWQQRRVSLQKEDDGWHLVLKNSEGVIRSISLKDIFKRSSSLQ